jgi:hypothetical protein
MDKAELDLKEAYARLKALSDNFPDRANRLVEPRYVEEFHELLALLQKHSSIDLGRFKVPQTAVAVRAGGRGSVTDLDGHDWYDLYFVKAKIEGLLGFFDLQWSEPKPRVGFRPQ